MPDPVAYLNGRFVPLAEAAVPVWDAGFVFGATVTDFARTYRGRLFRWGDHLARFRRDCGALSIPLDRGDAELTAAAEALVGRGTGVWPGRDLAVVTFATPGPLAHMAGGAGGSPGVTVGMHAFPIDAARYRRFFTDGAVLHPVVAAADPLPGVKHRSRLRWWLADAALRADPTAPPGALALPTLAEGSPTETAVGSLLLVVGGEIVTPAPPAVLDGVSVRVVEELCGAGGIPFARRPLTARDVVEASEAMIAGTAFGLAGVRRVGSHEYPGPGPVTRHLQAAWAGLTGVHPAAEFTVG